MRVCVDVIMKYNEYKLVHMQGLSGTKRALADVTVSTASMGRFDKKIAGEGDRSKLKSKRRKYMDNSKIKDESNRNMNVLASILGSR